MESGWLKEFMLSLLTTPLEILIGQIIGGEGEYGEGKEKTQHV